MKRVNMTPLEIEVKFYLPDPEKIHSRIQASGAVSSGKTCEYNLCFDDPQSCLFRRKALLRLRKTGNNSKLTYKGPPPEASRDFKVFTEQEVAVDDFDTMAAILEAIGFHKSQVYEKKRETWILEDGTMLCADLMPFGSFLEIEGRPGTIENAAKMLGLDWKKRILANYLAIFSRLKSEFSLGFSDVTFDNFARVNKDFSQIIREFEAG